MLLFQFRFAALPSAAGVPAVDVQYGRFPANSAVEVATLPALLPVIKTPLTMRDPLIVVAPRFVVPPVRLVKLPPVAEILVALSNVPPRKSPLRTMRFVKS